MAEKKPLSVITPEEAGIPSRAVAAFVKRLNDDQLCMHSFLMLKGGKILAEGYWGPYGPDDTHRMYSISKSFASIAIGLLYGEGRISLDDPITRFFPEKVPDEPHPYLARATVRDMLLMAAPQDHGDYVSGGPDWIKNFMHMPISHLPGTVFSYNTACSVLLTAIVERISGQKLLDYMRPRLLDPIGVSDDAWCIETPDGYSWGGSGVICTPRDLAKVALVCMNHGRHEGQQLIPADYIDAATARQIDSSVYAANPEFELGYGYQIWRTRHNGFAFRGMGSQLAIALPDQDFILVTTADTQGNASGDVNIYKALWEEIYPYLGGAPLPADRAAQDELATLISGMTLPLLPGAPHSPAVQQVSGKTYLMSQNAMAIDRVSFAFEQGRGVMRYTNAWGDCAIDFGFGHYIEQPFPQTNYHGKRIGTPSGKGYRTFASAAWTDAETLIIQAYLADDHLGNMRINARFTGRELTLFIGKSAEMFLDEYPGFASGELEE